MAFRLTNRDRLMAPRKCFVCETKPQHRVVDTGYNNFGNTAADTLRGRKYVCEACGEKIGKALGMQVQAQVNAIKDRLIASQNRVAELEVERRMSHQLDEMRNFLMGKEVADEAVEVESDPAE